MIRVRVTNARRVRRALWRLGNILRAPLYKQLALKVVEQTQRRFDREKTSPDGVPWKPWARTYKDRGRELLNLTGGLRDSIHGEWGERRAVVISDWPYAAVHQKGRRDKTVPARPFLGISRANESELIDVIHNHVRELAAKP